jgi:hypothetical protein
MMSSLATRTTITATAMAMCAMALLVWVMAALTIYARQYFFLFDDFALIELARTHSAWQLLIEPLTGFYRPLPFLLLRAETRLFGWDHPAGYLAINLGFHLVNATLCAWITSRLLPRTWAAAIAFVLVLASPWATEGFLWASALFDVSAACGVLIALAGVRLSVEPETRVPRVVHVALAAAGSLLAVFSKENAVVLPALAIAMVLIDRPLRVLIGRSTRLTLIACSLPVLLYLAVRASRLGLLAGAYGDFGELWRQTTVIANIGSYLRASVWLPMRPAWSANSFILSTLVRLCVVVLLLPIVVALLASTRPRLLIGCLAAFLIATLPICWFGLYADSTVGGRYAYLPEMFGAIIWAAALARTLDLSADARRQAIAVVPLAGMMTYAAASLLYQVEVWREACSLSRGVLQQLEVYRGRGDVALAIENMPFMFVEGPYVLKAYAFRLYGDDHQPPLPPLKARAWTVRFGWNNRIIASPGIDPSADYFDRAPDGLEELVVQLDLSRR